MSGEISEETGVDEAKGGEDQTRVVSGAWRNEGTDVWEGNPFIHYKSMSTFWVLGHLESRYGLEQDGYPHSAKRLTINK